MELSGTSASRQLSLTSPNMSGEDVKAWQRILFVMQKKVTLDLSSSSLGIAALVLAANAILANASRQTIFNLAQADFFDGVFGAYTADATKAYQRTLGLAATGVVDPLTAEKSNGKVYAVTDLNDDTKDALEFSVAGGSIINNIPGGKKTIGAGIILAIGAAILFFLKGKRGRK